MRLIEKWTLVWRKGNIIKSMPETEDDLIKILGKLKELSDYDEFVIYSTSKLRYRLTTILDKMDEAYITPKFSKNDMLIDFAFRVGKTTFFTVPRFMLGNSLITPFTSNDFDPKTGMIIDQ